MQISKKLLAIAAASLLGTAFTFPASAETVSGQLEHADQNSISGWVWDKDDYNHIYQVELHIFPTGSETEAATLNVKADDYRDDLQLSIGDGYHGFVCPVNWESLNGEEFFVKAYVVSENGKVVLDGTPTYKKRSYVAPKTDSEENQAPSSPVITGIRPGAGPINGSSESTVSNQPPASTKTESSQPPKSSTIRRPSLPSNMIGPGMPLPVPDEETEKKGKSLGLFTTSGYCNCLLCCSGENLTYSGTVPQSNHTISADLNILPLYTKVMIHDIIYTVEDIGNSVNGNRIDIYYDTHEEALAHGIEEVEVFLVEGSVNNDSSSLID